MGKDNDFLLNLLYRGTTTIQEFNWDNMITTPILQLISLEEIEYIRRVITSPKYSGNLKYRLNTINEVMHNRGFTKLAGGTNRVVYTHPFAPNAVFKIAIDSVGIKDNPAEYYNQQFLKPYCTKVFECSTCGTIASFERVERMTTLEEFYSIADDYYYLLSRVILGKYIMEDIGIDYFMNIGIRKGNTKFSGPVLLDFPYLYELDGKKLICDAELDDGSRCHGEVDYDAGFNKLICTKCGRRFRAHELAKPPESRGILIRSKGAIKMKFNIVTNTGRVVKTIDTTEEREFLTKPSKKTNDNSNVISNNGLIKVIRKQIKVDQQSVVVNNEKKSTIVNPTFSKEQPKEEKKVIVKRINISKPVAKKEDETPTVYSSANNNPIIKVIKKKAPGYVNTKTTNTADTKQATNPIRKENTSVPKTSVVKRVIAVSVGAKPIPSPEEVINVEKTESNIKVNLTTVKKDTPSTNTIKTIGKSLPLTQIHSGVIKPADKNVKYIDLSKKKEEVKEVPVSSVITTEEVDEEIANEIATPMEETKEEEVVSTVTEKDSVEEDEKFNLAESITNAVLEVIDEIRKEDSVVNAEVETYEEAEEQEKEEDQSTPVVNTQNLIPAVSFGDEDESNDESVTKEEAPAEESDSTDEEDSNEESYEITSFNIIYTSSMIENAIEEFGINDDSTLLAIPKVPSENDSYYFLKKDVNPMDIDFENYYIYFNYDNTLVEIDKFIYDENGGVTASVTLPCSAEDTTNSTTEDISDDSALEALAASASKPSVEDLMKN